MENEIRNIEIYEKRNNETRIDSDYKIKQLENELSEARQDLKRSKLYLRQSDNRYGNDNDLSYTDSQNIKSNIQLIDTFRKTNLHSNFSNYESLEFSHDNPRIDSANSGDYGVEARNKMSNSYIEDERRLNKYKQGKNL